MADNIIRHGLVARNEWRVITDTIHPLPQGKIILPLSTWLASHTELEQQVTRTGLLLDSNELPGQFPGDITRLPIIAINFPVFTDGRGFSTANILRQQYGYRGELRAYGAFIRDQLYYLKRCGFDSFESTTIVDLEAATKSLGDFSNDYQTSSNQTLPLFRRRK